MDVPRLTVSTPLLSPASADHRASATRSLHPYRVVLGVAAITVMVLAADARWPSLTTQAILAVIAWVVLVLLGTRLDPVSRQGVWNCVLAATLVELFGSIVWGVYRYRLGNVPMYVPPGHGVVYATAVLLSRTPLFTRSPAQTVSAAIGAAGIWAVGGLTVLPALTHRFDVFGALFFLCFAAFARRSHRGTFFAAVFVVTSVVEIAGTAFGDWRWQAVAPVIGIPSGNPPSVIAGAYCILEGVAMLLIGLQTRDWVPRIRSRQTP